MIEPSEALILLGFTTVIVMLLPVWGLHRSQRKQQQKAIHNS